MSVVRTRSELQAEGDWPRMVLDRDYRARDCVSEEEFNRILGNYRAFSVAAIREVPGRTGLLYDPLSGERLDLFGVGENSSLKPAILCIHGGYWRALSREDTAFMAPAFAAHGVVTVVPDYTLAPATNMTEIVRQVRAALAFVWHRASELGIDRGRILVAGSSAGGHLAACLLMPGWQAAMDLPEQPVYAAMPISGLFDLAPIAACHVQDWINLTSAEVEEFSPMRALPSAVPKMAIAVAEREPGGFHRQSATFAQAMEAPLMLVQGRNHFDLFLDLMDPASSLFRTALDLLE